jgi:Ran GTPase-activating protein (RanGAP) involved in mRNA processing and transport
MTLKRNFLAEMLKKNKTVKVLLLSCYNMVDDGAHALTTALAPTKTIKKVQLRDLRNQREAFAFFKALTSVKQLEELGLRHCQLDMNSAKALRELIESHQLLQEFRIVDSQMAATSFSQVCRRGVKKNEQLQILYFINTELNGDYSGRWIGSMLRINMSLQELHLGENSLGEDEGVAQISEGLLENDTLRTLDL